VEEVVEGVMAGVSLSDKVLTAVEVKVAAAAAAEEEEAGAVAWW
jgi:hypothetical protein